MRINGAEKDSGLLAADQVGGECSDDFASAMSEYTAITSY